MQFLRNGAVRITFKTSVDCDRVVSSRIRYRDVPLRVVSVDAKSRLVHLRDCPAEVPDDMVKRFFSSFGEVHSVSRSCHQAFPGIFDGNHVIKITLIKDVPGIVSVAGFECRVWYCCQPASCVVCKKLGHRTRSYPLNELCSRCRRPGHHAQECSNAWVPAAGATPASHGSAANPSGPAPASAAADAVPDPPPRHSASAEASVPVADPPNSGGVPAGQDAEMSDEEYVPSLDEDSDASSMDDVPASGDDEVVLAVSSSSPSGSPRRRRKRRRRTVSSAVAPVLVDMDTSEVEVPNRQFFRSFRGVWEDKVCWEEVRSIRPHYRAKVTPQEPPSTPVLFPFQSFSASASTPVPPASPVPSTFSSNGSVVDSVPTPTPGRPRAAPPPHWKPHPK